MTSDQDLSGYDVNLRKALLKKALDIRYSIRVLPSYGEMLVRAAGEQYLSGCSEQFVVFHRAS